MQNVCKDNYFITFDSCQKTLDYHRNQSGSRMTGMRQYLRKTVMSAMKKKIIRRTIIIFA